jgi:hypothetical protein
MSIINEIKAAVATAFPSAILVETNEVADRHGQPTVRMIWVHDCGIEQASRRCKKLARKGYGVKILEDGAVFCQL